MSVNGPKKKSPSFADDTILFCNGSKKHLEMILKTLEIYEEVSRQLINKEKNCFDVADNTNATTINKLKTIT